MPILLRVNELEEGMCLAAHVMNRYSMLLPNGHKLLEKDIISLKRMLPEESFQIVDPLLDEIVKFEDDSADRKVSQHVRQNILNITQKVSGNVRDGMTLTSENVAGMQRVLEEMMEYLQNNPVTTAIIEQSTGWDDYLQEHSANVFYLSVVIGNTIRNYIKNERERLSSAKSLHQGMNLTPLATAAMFHDIGMVPIDKLYRKKEPLTGEEKEQIRMHPQVGAQMLPDEVDAMVKLIVRTHHENQDGSGYPESLPGDKINIFARIIRVADAYSAAIADKIYKKARQPAEVLYEMLHGECRRFYDPVVLRVFSNIVQPFPIGAKLKLQSGMWAVVVRHDSQKPFNPKIVIAFDELGDPVAKEDLKEILRLGQGEETKIHSFGGQDMTFLNAPVSQETVESAEPVYSDLFDFAYP